ncbi:tetratricopeptide repeat protein [Gloeocapsa sp. PCC 73106]|uniref:tetratricopeptide repeat protein n=1 Tax=Gloeocapsa sp. PCC 73106 TaxID=102232 RepID=UPI0002AD1BF2|nr:tetratricopeptide repeat protein [Gloeocapsa sp. PCC 73106]ELR99726.1 hypothetical protein GLO73106DRAFT_00035780 [Gloeocapsa sp. PCC 73106]
MIESYYNQGWNAYQQGNYAEAIACFDQVLSVNQKRAEPFYYRGLAYSRSGDYARAIADFDAAIELKPDWVEVYREKDQAQKAQARPQPKAIDLGNGVTLELVSILGGEFTMGGDKLDCEKPKHRVTIKPFWLGKTQVTQAQWRAVAKLPQVETKLEESPFHFKGDNLPVETVSWLDCQEFCARIKKKTGETCRLPSEAEWEYACRAGSKTEYSFGDNPSSLGEYAWYSDNSNAQTHPVAIKKPNPWGLYDMHGNVWEWCEDSWRDSYDESPNNAFAWSRERSSHVTRGGSWGNSAVSCRSAYRFRYAWDHCNNYSGFRVVFCFFWDPLTLDLFSLSTLKSDLDSSFSRLKLDIPRL